jgi:hypothetical protein
LIKRSILRLFCAGCLMLLGLATIAPDPYGGGNILAFGVLVVGFLWATLELFILTALLLMHTAIADVIDPSRKGDPWKRR